jgi:hypothetical protein
MGGLAYMQRVAADELFAVSATVHVPVPQTPAVIAQPAEGDTVPSGDTMIVGSCPIVSPAPIIVITVDGKTVGSAACNTSSDFSFSTRLMAGPHEIITTPYTIDNDHGPDSGALHITSHGAITASTQTATLASTSPFTTLASNKTVTWQGTLTGTKPSYKLLMEWGDGSYDSYTMSAGPVHLTHRYAQFASYNITVGLQDDAGRYQYEQFAAAATDPTTLVALGSTDSDQPASHTNTVIGLYGLFVTLVCVTAIVRLHAAPFAYTPIQIGHHAAT